MNLARLRSGARRLAVLRGPALGLVLLLMTYGFADFLNGVRPLDGWLFFQLLKIWAWQALLTLGCASFGHWVLTRVLRLSDLAGSLKLALSLAIGLVGFGVGIYLGGYLHLLGRVWGALLPVVLLAIGAPAALPALQQAYRSRAERRPITLPALLAIGFGVLGCGILYLGVLSPDSLNYDSTWNHLVIAQDYAREGRIVWFPGDWVKNVPHFGSIINTWAFLVPGFDKPALHWMMALHNEFTIFLWTLVGVQAGARYMAERLGVRGAWPAMLLFPGIFVYDGNMGAAADHFLAVFAVPMFLGAALFMARPRWQEGALLGICAGGGLLTKFHAVYLLLPLSACIAVRLGLLLVARLRKRPAGAELARALGGAAVGLGVALCLVALHFGKNYVFYHNPLYPMAQGRFHSYPSLPDAQFQMDYLFADWRWHPPVALGERAKAALSMVLSFSFKPHYTFIGDIPTFGSLLTLLLPAVPFLGVARRLWLGVVACLGALFVWAFTFWVDRNLQTIMPLMAAVVAAICVRAWELGKLARVGVVALCGLQLVWGSDYYFSGSDRISNAITLIRSGMDGRAAARFDGYRRDFVALGKALPKNAVLMLHNQHVMLGIDRPVLLDWVGFQGIIDYHAFHSLRDFQRRLQEIGVTHIAWAPGARLADTKQETVIFEIFASRYLGKSSGYGGLRVAELPKEPVQESEPMLVFNWNVPNYANGTYQVSDLFTIESIAPQLQHYAAPRLPATSAEAALEQLGRAHAVLMTSDANLPTAARELLKSRFSRVTSAAGLQVYHVRSGKEP